MHCLQGLKLTKQKPNPKQTGINYGVKWFSGGKNGISGRLDDAEREYDLSRSAEMRVFYDRSDHVLH